MGEGVFLVAVAEGEVVGFADFCLVYGDEVELATVCVLPEMQGPVC
jgi:N-acetylglutamate synthase-like GNAT family acetyltransferase